MNVVVTRINEEGRVGSSSALVESFSSVRTNELRRSRDCVREERHRLALLLVLRLLYIDIYSYIYFASR